MFEYMSNPNWLKFGIGIAKHIGKIERNASKKVNHIQPKVR